MNQIPDAFVKRIKKEQNFLVTSVGISHPYDEDHITRKPKPHWTSGLWDTGASHCLITKSLAENFDLNPIDKVMVEHAKGRTYENVYLAFLQITDRYYLEVELTECQSISNNFEIIIGMDVISKGDFAVTSKKGEMCFSFRLPSLTTIDFTKG
ncbi:MAG: aspartyl protease family protein [Crocinitomicaceae bacterium]